MAVALEAHLSECRACADDVAALRQTWAALAALPEVAPPAEFARRVAARVAEEQWARRASRPDLRSLWQGWLRSLTPVHAVGAAAAVALLAVGIAVPLSQTEPGVRWSIVNLERERPAVTIQDHPPAIADPTLAPRVTARAPRWENGRWVGIVELTPLSALPGASVRATTMTRVDDRMAGAGAFDVARGDMRAFRAYALPIPLEASGLGAHVVMLGIASPALAQEYRKVVALPVPDDAVSGAITLDFRGEDVYVALARLAAATRRPIVADAGLTGKVSRSVTAATPEQALNTVLAPLGYRWQANGESYLVTRY